jgi:hypothetical protein
MRKFNLEVIFSRIDCHDDFDAELFIAWRLFKMPLPHPGLSVHTIAHPPRRKLSKVWVNKQQGGAGRTPNGSTRIARHLKPPRYSWLDNGPIRLENDEVKLP